MIPVESLIYKIDMKLNKNSSLQNQEIPLENKILALNEGQIKLVKTKLNPNNTLQIGNEGMKKRYEELKVLVESAHDHKLSLKIADEKLNMWSSDASKLKPSYMFYVNGYLLAEKEGCKDRVIYINHDLTKHGDVETLLNNTNYKPSFEYQETFNTLSGNNIEVYTDGTFIPSELYVSYIRYPEEIDYPGYIKFNGEESKKQDCELPLFLEDELLNLVIQELGMNTENVPAVQFTKERLTTQE